MDERLTRLQEAGWIANLEERSILQNSLAGQSFLEGFVENVTGAIALPVGLVTNLVLNGTDRLVPLATEEPSIVAACCKSALLVRDFGGVTAQAGERRIGGQVLLEKAASLRTLRREVAGMEAEFLEAANNRHMRIAAAGGGTLRIGYRALGNLDGVGVVDITCHPGDAMGANFVDDVAQFFLETYAPRLSARAVTAIVTNHPLGKPAKASVKIPTPALAWEETEGREVARRIALLSDWAMGDALRRATHNKGILNGLLAFLQASAQDLRGAVVAMNSYLESTSHGLLARWTVADDHLVGTFEAPIHAGTVGGTGPHLPTTALYYRWSGISQATDLEEVAGAIGLLQSLGALRVLATSGIQAGHMKLHGRKNRG